MTLRVEYGTDVETLVERGTFSTGVRVERTSDILAFAPWTGAAPDCTVVSTRFADGTAWLPEGSRRSGASGLQAGACPPRPFRVACQILAL